MKHVGLAVGSTIVTAVLAGAASALSIISNGIPADYNAAAVPEATPTA
jgi:hypothetical protein